MNGALNGLVLPARFATFLTSLVLLVRDRAALLGPGCAWNVNSGKVEGIDLLEADVTRDAKPGNAVNDLFSDSSDGVGCESGLCIFAKRGSVVGGGISASAFPLSVEYWADGKLCL